MLSLKVQMVLATVAAILLSLLLLGIGYFFAPYILNKGDIPMPVPSAANQFFTSFLLIGLVALISFCTVVLGVAISRIRQRKIAKSI
jgi:hypothetical protein